MHTVFIQIIILLLFVAAGFTLGKTGLVRSEHSKVLSTLLVYVFLPCNILKTFWSRFNPSYLSANWADIAISTVIVAILAIGSHFAVKLFTKDKYERSVQEYSLVVSNSGYMGYSLAESVFGTAMGIMTMALPMQVYIYTVGFAMLTKTGLNLKKLINPVVIATVAGMILGLTRVPFPTVAENILDSASACMAPVSMILTGLIISEFKLREIALNPRIYPVIILKLIIIPLAVGGILSLFASRATVATAVLLYSLPCGMNSVVFPKLVGEDCRVGAGIALVSTLLSALTIPLIFLVFGI